MVVSVQLCEGGKPRWQLTGCTCYLLFQLAQQEPENLTVQGKEGAQPKLTALTEQVSWGLSLQNPSILMNLTKFAST